MITAADLVAEAEALYVIDAPEVRCRSVISRAYYAAYHTCDKRARHAGYQHKPGAGGTHQQLFSFMKDCADAKLRRARRRLMGLYEKRINADYRLGVQVNLHMAKEAIEEMTEIVSSLVAVN